MTAQVGWLIAALVILFLLAQYAPRFAAAIVILIVVYISFQLVGKGIL
jgi:hypothetical protein